MSLKIADDADATDTDDTDHSHCNGCYFTRCRLRTTTSTKCPIESCDLACGASLHQCKLQEHQELVCPNRRVPCINKLYGCPIELLRSELRSHLSVCPASVVHCSAEWNRWPIYARERNQVVPGVRTNFHARQGQLDVALALRDQRLLKDASKVPRRVRKALKDPRLNWRSPVLPMTQEELRNKFLVWEQDGDERTDCRETIEHQSQENNNVTMLPFCDNSTQVIAEQTHENMERPSTFDTPLGNISEDFPGAGNAVEIPLNDSLTESNTTVIDHPSIPPPSLSVDQVLSLDLTVESITKYQAKPRSMYSFMCSQVFRRDQYPWHVQNIHTEIYAGLNGWIQHRCPLAHYGCTHSITRFSPTDSGHRLVYSLDLESFGVLGPAGGEPPSSWSLLDLPVEVLEQIAVHLDGFSLNNLALTCLELYNICYNVLKRKGIVQLQWEKSADVTRCPQWAVSGKIWMFPNSVTPIRSWIPEDFFSMSNHLQHCHFNRDKNRRTERTLVLHVDNEVKVV